MSEKVFAYGSNICSGRLRDYLVRPEGHSSSALLGGYRLCFDKRSRDGSGKANVEPHTNGEVWGVLYTIPDIPLKILDHGEGPGYSRQRMLVCTADGATMKAWVYFTCEPSRDRGLRPYTWYKRLLVDGAKEHGLPAQYIETLEHIEANLDKNREREREKLALSCSTEQVGGD